MPLLTLLTDFGTRDYYVAAVKGTVLGLAPESRIVDLSHDLEPGDVEGAAFLLAAAAPAFPAGTVHLAVVDPGVGSARHRLVLAACGQLFVAPDNGLLTHLFDAGTVRAIERKDLDLAAPGETFHGRDRFAPVAAALLRGLDPAALGPEIGRPVRLPIPLPRRERDGAVGRVAHVDRFGNLVTDLPSGWLPAGCAFELRCGGALAVTRRAACYAEIPPGEPAVVAGSLGTLELSLRDASLAGRSGCSRGDAVLLRLR
ncbi:MAG TPA: SAM-dependent chlorinase/fluorinase [Thermoanaerobaculia bacterium]|nr:SAM-dependent chlorinase/fluorinase [Thermoanaerobaculia bacterium]